VKTEFSADREAEQELYLLLTNLFLLLDDTDRQFFGEFGLSTRQFWALHHLSETDSLSMIELSRLLLTDKSNVTAITDRLTTRGLVRRRAAPQDRRVSLLSITPAGRQLYDLVLAAHHERIRTLIDSDEATLRHVLQVLGAIRDRYEQHLHARATQTSSPYTLPAADAAKTE
jgi:DNA-binding MarR family transcriptional regulator